MIKKAINWIKARLPRFWLGDVSFSLWEYGTCNGIYARRHKVNKNVQFIIFKKGDQKHVNGIGHTHDKWVDFDISWWDNFTPTN